ncbi:MAG: transposase [Anaerolineaceae bacterium]|nr:MAG: transposase [Anaerolineaceae bacterium]
MEDVLDVYQRPYKPEYPQVCLDEISKTLHSTPRGSLPLEPGKPRREDHEYERHGQSALFLAIEPLQGFRRVWVSPRRIKLDFAQVLKELVDELYTDAKKIVWVVDNLNIYHAACLYERFPPAEARRIAAKNEWHLHTGTCQLAQHR